MAASLRYTMVSVFRHIFPALCIAALMILSAVTLPAACPHLISTYTMEEGLPSSWIYDLVEGPDGRIWFATRNSVAAFDGLQWQRWDSRDGLPSRRFTRIVVDSEGVIWALAPRFGRPVVHSSGNGWSTVEGPTVEGRAVMHLRSLAVLRGPGGQPVVALSNLLHGMWLGGDSGWRLKRPGADLPGTTVRMVVARGNRFIVATDDGVCTVAIDGTVDTSLNELLPDDDRDVVTVFAETPESSVGPGSGRIWILTTKSLSVIEDGVCRCVRDGLRVAAHEDRSGVLQPDLPDAVFFGNLAGLFRLDLETGQLQRLDWRRGLINDGVSDLMQDREGNIWATGFRGTCKLVHTDFSVMRQADGLLEDEVSAICEPWPGTRVLGHDRGLSLVDEDGIRQIPFNPSGTGPLDIWRVLDLAGDGRDTCWVAASNLGLGRLRRGDTRVTWIPTAGQPQERITSVLVRPDGQVLAGGQEGVYRLANHRLEPVALQGPKRLSVRRLFAGESGDYYLASSNNGLFLVHGNVLTQVPGLEEDENRRVVAVHRRDDGHLWVGTWGGLFIPRDGRLQRPEGVLGTIDEPVFFITENDDGLIWLGTNNGLLRWDGTSLRRYGIRDGLAGLETNRAAGFVDLDGVLWVGTAGGLSYFTGNSSIRPVNAPLISIRSSLAGDRPLRTDQPGRVGHRRNTLTFEYAAISFTDEFAVRYQYYLEGFDEDWLPEVAATERQARFTSLPAGRYRFHVRAAGAARVWSDPVTTGWVHIRRPMWGQWWFITLAGFGIIGVLVLGVTLRARSRYAQRLEYEVASRTAALRDSEERYRLLFHDASVGNLIVDQDDGTILDANTAAGTLFGLPVARLEGSAGTPVVAALIEEILLANPFRENGPGRVTVSATLDDTSGIDRHLELRGTPLRLQNRDCVLITVLDVSDRRKLEDERLRADRLASLGVLAGGIAHDFNNLLTAIIGNLSLAREDVPRGGDLDDVLQSVETASQSARHLANRLLTFSDGGVPVRRTADLGALVRETTALALSGASTAADVEVSEDLWPASVDIGQMSQVVNNLVINAHQASLPGGRIRVRADNVDLDQGDIDTLAAGPYLRITVTDGGAGIPQEILPRIFDPYFSTKDEGRGLGLAIVHSVIKAHSGDLVVESGTGQGSTFQVLIPAIPGESMPEAQPNRAIPGGKGRILVMDDKEQVLMFYRMALTRLGYDVETAAEGGEALKLFENSSLQGKPFDAVILDLTVPGGLGGRETMEQLLHFDPGVRAVVASGYSEDPVLADPAAYGFSAVLSKPFTIQTLAGVLQQMLNGGFS